MLKAAGILLILTAGIGMGFSKSYALTRRERALSAVLRMTLLLKGEIRYGNAALPEAFLDVAGKTEGVYREFLKDCAERMRQGRGKQLGEIFGESAAQLDSVGLFREDLEGLVFFGGRLGYLDLQMQLRQIEAYEAELSETLDGLRRDMPVKKKLYQSLGASLGILLAILVC